MGDEKDRWEEKGLGEKGGVEEGEGRGGRKGSGEMGSGGESYAFEFCQLESWAIFGRVEDDRLHKRQARTWSSD